MIQKSNPVDLSGGVFIIMNQIEMWKDVPNFEGIYQCSNLGTLKSLERFGHNQYNKYLKKERIIKQHINCNGYYHVKLHKNSKSYWWK